MYTSYWGIAIQPLDLDFIEKVCDAIGVEYYDADVYLDPTTLCRMSVTNQVISYVLTEWVLKHVKDSDDQEKLLDSIYLNCLDSGYNIDEEDLTEDGQAYLKLFNSY